MSLRVADQPLMPAATEARTAATGWKARSGTTSRLPTDRHDTRARYVTAAGTNELGVDLGYKEDCHLLVLRGFQPRGESELVTSTENPESERACRAARDPGRTVRSGWHWGPSGQRAEARARGGVCARPCVSTRVFTCLRVCMWECARDMCVCVRARACVHMHASTCTWLCVCVSVLRV